MKTFLLPIILVASVASVGLVELSWLFVNNSQATLSTRLSQSFFTIFTIIPLSMIGTGIAIAVFSYRKNYERKIKLQMILFGILVILAGCGAFSLNLLD
jgi:hypothetical protein